MQATKQQVNSSFKVIRGPAHLPDPGIPVFLRLHNDEHPLHNALAVLHPNIPFFKLAQFYGGVGHTLALGAVKSWDYAVPAGDML